MAVAQDTFQQYRDNGYEGQISTIDVADVISRKIETAAVPFGRAAVSGTGKRSAKGASGATAAQIIGFTVRSMAVENNASDLPEYSVGETASILRRGRMYAKCVGGAAKGASVFVVVNTAGGDEIGQLRGTADSTNTVELKHVKWIEAAADGQIGEIQVDGILTS